MSGLGKLLRTTAFKLAAAYLVAFTIIAFVALGWVAWNASRALDLETAATIEADVRGLSEQYSRGGMVQLTNLLERRVLQPGASVYLLTSPQGEPIVGNVADLPSGVLETAGGREVRYRRADDPAGPPRLARVRVYVLPQGFRLLVGRDLEDRFRLRQTVLRTFGWALTLLAVVGGLGALMVARRVLRRVDAMTATTERIMAGDLAGRHAIAGTNDEFDRLARNLNAMLDRIGVLMTGMKEVSDNIAHDLKTPLTRLRNRAEEALREGRGDADHRAALERVIEEADGLIKVFNALLTIARLESGNATPDMAPFDLAAMARDLGELYGPSAEEAGLSIEVEAPLVLPTTANRELVGQAIANLIDNAIKYGHPAPEEAAKPAPITLAVREVARGVAITVADRGPGIAAADRERALERFGRLDASRGEPGFGLGLSLVGAIARRHGGSFRLEDNAPGLRAVLTLPMREIG